jgi:hypothetical protein
MFEHALGLAVVSSGSSLLPAVLGARVITEIVHTTGHR